MDVFNSDSVWMTTDLREIQNGRWNGKTKDEEY